MVIDGRHEPQERLLDRMIKDNEKTVNKRGVALQLILQAKIDQDVRERERKAVAPCCGKSGSVAMVATDGEKERCRSIGFDRDADESEEERRGDAGSLGLIMARKALKKVSLPRSSLDGVTSGRRS